MATAASTPAPHQAVHEKFRKGPGTIGIVVFGVALLASGLASSTVGTQAGQVIMDGFTGRRIPVLWRRALTALPSLVILALPVSPGQALLYSQVVLSFGLPFVLFPLLALTRDASVMGRHVSGRAAITRSSNARTVPLSASSDSAMPKPMEPSAVV